jgi:DNA-directed RNA polymerase alpha subunit
MTDEHADQSHTLPYTIPTTDLKTEFPPRMGKVSRRELARAGYTRFEQLTSTTPDDLLAIHGVGKKAVDILREELGNRGMSFGKRGR